MFERSSARREGAHADRDLLQVLLASLRGHHDLLEATRVLAERSEWYRYEAGDN